MTDTPPKPKRRRWRWLVVGLLFAVSIAAWWQWPRGDARFVGSWTMQVRTSSMTSPVATLSFWASGAGKNSSPAGPTTLRFRWYVERERLVIGGVGLGLSGRVLDWVQRMTLAVFNTGFLTDEEVYEIVEVTDSTIRLRGQGPAKDAEVILSRLPE